MNRAENFSRFKRPKLCARLKCDTDRLYSSRFGRLNFSRYSFHSVRLVLLKTYVPVTGSGAQVS